MRNKTRKFKGGYFNELYSRIMDIVNYIIRLFHIKSNKKKEVAKVVAEEEGLSPEDIKNFLERF